MRSSPPRSVFLQVCEDSFYLEINKHWTIRVCIFFARAGLQINILQSPWSEIEMLAAWIIDFVRRTSREGRVVDEMFYKLRIWFLFFISIYDPSQRLHIWQSSWRDVSPRTWSALMFAPLSWSWVMPLSRVTCPQCPVRDKCVGPNDFLTRQQ